MVFMFTVSLLALLASAVAASDSGAWVPGDTLPQAPVLAGKGSYKFCSEELTVVRNNSKDVLNWTAGYLAHLFNPAFPFNASVPPAVYDRPIKIRVWAPVIGETSDGRITYTYKTPADIAPLVGPTVSYRGYAHRDCAALGRLDQDKRVKWPLVVLSHGLPGIKEGWSNHAENLASRGYVVVGIDHTDTTSADYTDILHFQNDFPRFFSALYYRKFDQLAVYDSVAELADDKTSFLYGNVDPNNTVVWGYSFGGYGAAQSAGATADPVAHFTQVIGFGPPQFPPFAPLYSVFKDLTVSETRPGFKALVLFSPWGHSVKFDTKNHIGARMLNIPSLANVKIPTLVLAGSDDEVIGDSGITELFNGLTSSPGRVKVTLAGASHNLALNPPPPEWIGQVNADVWEFYSQTVWDHRLANNVGQHFVVAFLDQVLNQKSFSTSANEYFVSVDAGDIIYDHSFIKGFPSNLTAGAIRFDY